MTAAGLLQEGAASKAIVKRTNDGIDCLLKTIVKKSPSGGG